MSKRRLSEQQKRRISRQRSLGSEKDTAPAFEQCNGRVVSHYGRQLEVEDLADDSGRTVRCHQRANLPSPVTGDMVIWEKNADGSGVVTAVAQRRNEFSRPDSQGRQRPVAANLDVVQVVIACKPEPFANLIDRYLVAIENLDLQAALVLNKIDLGSTDSESIDKMLSMYSSLGYPVFRVSAETGAGIQDLTHYLEGRTTVLVGQSGVGKSSLLNRLAGDQQALVGDLSVGKDKGTHTTTTARLYHLSHCDLVDSPGIREYNLSPFSAAQLCQGFVELRALAGQCKFRNCSHQSEPGCALGSAAESGAIDPRRWLSFQRLLNDASS
ncbi:MAG: ribosome small subunit-dependent GTPase A [Pseudomonadales bacterium]|nr:ribosome small subunit-dependent GTPase A [Pseudomonadales bacterium]